MSSYLGPVRRSWRATVSRGRSAADRPARPCRTGTSSRADSCSSAELPDCSAAGLRGRNSDSSTRSGGGGPRRPPTRCPVH